MQLMVGDKGLGGAEDTSDMTSKLELEEPWEQP